jgi:hypothetical protein
VGSRTAASALLVAGAGKLRFLPAANWFGTPSSLTLRVVDNSGGSLTSGTVVNTSSSGGTTVYSLATVSLSTSVTAVNDAPTTSNIPLSATKNATSTFSLSSSEVDSGTSSTLDALVTSYKIMSLPSQGSIKTSSNGTISVNDVLTVAQATNMKYTPTTNYVGSDSFSFLAIDAAAAQSNTSNVNITVAPFNEAPTTSMPSAVTVAEDSSANLLGNPSVADSDAGSATVKVTLSVINGSVTLSSLAGLTDAASGGAALTSATFASQVFYGTMTAINTALTGLKYAPTANYYGSDTLTLVVDDLGNATPPAKTATGTQSITVTNVPDAPVTGAATLAAITEDPIAVTGASISALLTNYTDADSNSLAGIAVSTNAANATTEGVWQYSLNSGASWNSVSSVSAASALLLPSSARLRFLPVANFYGSPAGLTVHAVDNSVGRTFTSNPASRQTLNVSSAGGDYDSTGTTLGTTVNGVNDVFQIVNDQDYVVSEGGTVVLASSVLSITDVEASASQIVYTILSAGTVITEGLLQKDTSGSGTWTTLSATNTFTQADINNGRIRYVHGGGEPTVLQKLAYTVTDDVAGAGGTTATRNLNIPVTAVNDAPLVYFPGDVVPGTPPVTLVGSVEVGTTLTFTTANITVTDPDNTAEQLVFRIESLPSNGVLQLNGNDLGVNSTFNFAEIKTNASFSYTPSAGVGTDSFTVSLRDGAGGVLGAAGGTPATPLQVNLQIIPRNFSPVIVSETYSMLELEQNVNLQLDVSDTEDTDANLTIEVVQLPAVGEAVLKFNGTSITATGYTFNGSQSNLLTITHTSTDRVNPPDVSFKLKITDRGNPVGTNVKSTTSTFNIEVREVDDDPTLTVTDFNLSAQGATYTINKEPVGSPNLILDGNDVDTADSKLLYRVTRIPASGLLLLNDKPLGVGGTFTQSDVDSSKLKYKHNGYGSTSDFFRVTLRDQGFNIRYNRPGGVYPNNLSTALLVEKTVNITIPAAGGGSPGSGGQGGAGSGAVTGVYQDVLYTNKNITLKTPTADLLANDGGYNYAPNYMRITSVTMGANTGGTVSLGTGADLGKVVFVPNRGFYGITGFDY